MDWTKPLISLTLYATNKTKRIVITDRTFERKTEREKVSALETSGERLRQYLCKQTKRGGSQRVGGGAGNEIQTKKSLSGLLNSLKRNSLVLSS